LAAFDGATRVVALERSPGVPVLYRMPFRRGELLKSPFRLLACAVLVALPIAAVAQTESFYVAPKLLAKGNNQRLWPAGSVTVQSKF